MLKFLIRQLFEEDESDSIGAVAANADFFAPLTTSVVLSRGVGSATFTRATTATVTDFEGLVRTALSGEVRFQGARRVRNFVTNSGDLTSASWSKDAGMAEPVGGVSDPDGGTSAYTLTANSGSVAWYRQPAASVTISDSVTSSLWIRRRTGSGAIKLLNGNATDGPDISGSLTSAWKRFAVVATAAAAGSLCMGVRIAASGDAVDVYHPLLELVTGQSNQNPSEYVSVGVLASPYHGAMVDGVKYFDYQNGNTVASSVVTEAQGAAISTSTLLGCLLEQQSTNLVLQSENFGTTWTTNGAPTRTAGAKTCGSVSLDLIGDVAGTADGYAQNITFTGNAVKAASFFIAQGTSTSTRVDLNDVTAAALRLHLNVTWVGGAPTVTMTVGTLLGVDALGNGTYRVRVATTAVTAANTNQLRVFPATDAAGTGANTGNVYMGGVQAEDNTFCTSYIPTTTATVTRNADVPTCPNNLSATDGTLYAEVTTMMPNGASGGYVLSTSGNSVPLFIESATGQVRFFDTANNNTGAAWTRSATTPVKAATKWSGAAGAACANGTLAPATAFDGSMDTGTMYIGNNNGSNSFINGTIRNLRIWKRALPDATLQVLTA